MKKIAIYCVTYNSYKELEAYITSIDLAAKAVKGRADVNILIADNTESEPQAIEYVTEYCTIKYFPFHKNLGYFGAVSRMMTEETPLQYNYSIISNVDMTFCEDTLSALLAQSFEGHTGWIAPNIIARYNRENRSIQAVHRYSAKKLKILQWLYQHPFFYELYCRTLHKTKHNISLQVKGKIYAGHGSCIILTNEYFKQCGILKYPIFLYGEEIYLAEECYRHSLTVQYSPDIVVEDIGQVSTGKAQKTAYYKWNCEAITYLLNTYFNSRR